MGKIKLIDSVEPGKVGLGKNFHRIKNPDCFL